MKTIWKWTLDLKPIQTLTIPFDTKFIHVAFQGVNLCIWGETDTRNKNFHQEIYIVGTGDKVPKDSKYIGTVLQLNDNFVWHVYCEE